jgi:NAD(P)-dependent dehydrogenase (short-subunit alcohol dehydrogenase family)
MHMRVCAQAACEWAPDNVRVNAVQPWYIATPLAEQVLQHEEYKQQVLHRYAGAVCNHLLSLSCYQIWTAPARCARPTLYCLRAQSIVLPNA